MFRVYGCLGFRVWGRAGGSGLGLLRVGKAWNAQDAEVQCHQIKREPSI